MSAAPHNFPKLPLKIVPEALKIVDFEENRPRIAFKLQTPLPDLCRNNSAALRIFSNRL